MACWRWVWSVFFHVAPVGYFRCLRRVATGNGTLQSLQALEPQPKKRDFEFEAHEPLPQAKRARSPRRSKPSLGLEGSGSDDFPDPPSPFADAAEADVSLPPLLGSVRADAEAVTAAPETLAEQYSEDAVPEPPSAPSAPGRNEPSSSSRKLTVERKRQDKTHSWGAFLITHKIQKSAKGKTQQSWQATCSKPEHRTVGKSKCTKTMSFNPDEPGAEQACLWRIRHWCNSCHMFNTKSERQKYHPLLADLPEETAIRACKIDTFDVDHGPAAPGAGAKRKRSRACVSNARTCQQSQSSSSSSSSSDTTSSSS